MPFVRTRQQVVEKAIRDGHAPSDIGTTSLRTLHHFAVEQWDEVWTLISGDRTAGIGRATRAIDVAAGATMVDLPSEFLFLRGLVRSDMAVGETPVHVSPVQALQNQWVADGVSAIQDPPYAQGAYYLEGGGTEFDTGMSMVVTRPRRIRIMPAAMSDMTLTLVYITQAPSFGEPDNEADDSTAIDFFAQPNFTWVANRVRLMAAGRGDTQEFRAAQALDSENVIRVLTQMAPDQHRILTPDSYTRRGGERGY